MKLKAHITNIHTEFPEPRMFAGGHAVKIGTRPPIIRAEMVIVGDIDPAAMGYLNSGRGEVEIIVNPEEVKKFIASLDQQFKSWGKNEANGEGKKID